MQGKTGRCLSLVLVVLVTVALSGPAGWAAPLPSQTSSGSAEQVDAKAMAAERELVTGKLMEFELTKAEAGSRVDLLTDQEVHMLADSLESLQIAGDEIRWTTETVLLLLILVVLIAS